MVLASSQWEVMTGVSPNIDYGQRFKCSHKTGLGNNAYVTVGGRTERDTSENRRRINIYLSQVQGMLGSHFVRIHVKSASSDNAGCDNSDRVWTTLVCAPVTDRLRDGRAGFRLVPSTGDLEHDLLSWPLASQIRIYMRSCGLVAGQRNKFSPTPPLN